MTIIYCNPFFPQSERLNSNLPFIAKCTSGKGKENGEGLDPQASSTRQSSPASREVALSVLSAPCAALAMQAGLGRNKKTLQPACFPDSLLQSLTFNHGIKNPLAGFGEKSFSPGAAPAWWCVQCSDVPQHPGCRITVRIKASLISSAFHDCSQPLLPVSFTLHGNDAGKTSTSCGQPSPRRFTLVLQCEDGWKCESGAIGRSCQLYLLREGLLRGFCLFSMQVCCIAASVTLVKDSSRTLILTESTVFSIKRAGLWS